MLLSVRELLVRQRTQLVNAMRGHAAEIGVVAPLGDKGLGRAACRDRDCRCAAVPAAAEQAIALLGAEVDQLEARLRSDRCQADAAAQGQPRQSAAGRDPGDRSDERR